MSSSPKKPSRIVALPYQDTGVGYIRILQPSKVMAKEGLYDECKTYPFSGDNQGHFYDFPDDFYLFLTENASVMWSNVIYKPEHIIRLLNLRKLRGAKLIYDIDDNLYAIPADNPAGQFSNKLKNNFESCLRFCDGITVSVPNLKEVYGHLNKNILVVPNALDFAIWDKLKHKTRKPSRKVRIGWRGAYGHKDDFEMIVPVLRALERIYPIEVVTFGVNDSSLKTEHHEWVTYFDYPQKLADLQLDIAIIPLIDSAYNRCKSNLGYLEYSALKVPTVLSPIENQKGLVSREAVSKHDWYEHLADLIVRKEKRIELGENAYEFVKKNYNIVDTVKPVHKWFTDLPYRSDLEPD